MTVAPEPIPPVDAPPAGAARVADFVDLDLTKATTFRTEVPHAAFDVLRTKAPVAWHDEVEPPGHDDGGLLQFVPSPGFWVVTRHADVTAVSRNPALFSSALGGVQMPTMAPEALVMFRSMMLNMDPPDHTRLRRILQPIFTPRAVQLLHDAIDRNAGEILDTVGPAGECDFVPDIAAEMPLRVLADLLGMPRADRHLIYEWSNRLLGLDDPARAGDAAESMGAIGELLGYGLQIASERRAEPRDDLVSLIANAEVDGERLSDDEFAMFWLLLVIAGNETTRNALTGAVIALREQSQWEWLRDHPEALPQAVEELVRFVSPVMQFRRTATTDTQLGGQQVRAGDKVVVFYGAANRDPEVFADPHRLDLTRDPNPHVGFGVGQHFCLGAHLARLEMVAMLAAIFERLPDLEPAETARRFPSNFINGYASLPVRYTPA